MNAFDSCPHLRLADSLPVFNLTRAIELLAASAESGITFGSPWQPYCAGAGLRTSFLVGEGAPFSPLQGQSSDAYTEIVRLEDGFYLQVIKDERSQTSHVIAPGEDWLKISFTLDSKGLQQTFGPNTRCEAAPGRISIYLHPPGVVKVESVAGGCWGTSATLYVSRDFLRPHVEANLTDLPDTVLAFLEGTPKELIYKAMPMTSLVMRAVLDIVCTKYLGQLRHTFVRAKGYELLCEVIYLLTYEAGASRSDLRLSARDKRQLQMARDIISKDYADTPSIETLARQVGLNPGKLKAGFTLMFGIPIFRYLQNLKLERAMQLLHSGDYSVREIADAVGYMYSKNFTTAFKNRYGVTPNAARRCFDRLPKPVGLIRPARLATAPSEARA